MTDKREFFDAFFLSMAEAAIDSQQARIDELTAAINTSLDWADETALEQREYIERLESALYKIIKKAELSAEPYSPMYTIIDIALIALGKGARAA